MLVDLKVPLEAGKPVPLELTFRRAGRITVQLSVETADAPAGM
jgi:copper(I)-binding protein